MNQCFIAFVYLVPILLKDPKMLIAVIYDNNLYDLYEVKLCPLSSLVYQYKSWHQYAKISA